ncbi:MAG TPA: AAA family ATPase, partial [Kiritimatiellia bacterium]|nr:AAA family ATPase [Kiritimatiellia bacterium]
MITLRHVTIHKFKCFESAQDFDVHPKVTVLVGKNESGKTTVLEAIAKSNYFVDDKDFKFEPILDYPRKEKKKYDKAGQVGTVITCSYEISKELLAEIAKDLGQNVFTEAEFRYSRKYDNNATWEGVSVDLKAFFDGKFLSHSVTDDAFKAKILSVRDLAALRTIAKDHPDEPFKSFINHLEKYFQNEYRWANPIEEYVARLWIKPRLPKLIYYSDYYALPSRINLQDLQNGSLEDAGSTKTAKALLELADINLSQLVSSTSFENYIAELEATANEITQQLFQYWTTNKDLRIRFQIDKQMRNGQLTPILDIRVEDLKHMVSLPLRSRSKGFNWFFSFIVWFSKIQEDKKADYILLLDEPGLNLHASAQDDLLKFIEVLAQDYQILFTTHSPFMIDSNHLDRVRTVFGDEQGTTISDSLQERDPDTLFPLQAALGYDIAQNLFISKHNLLVEGASDLLYLSLMSAVLTGMGRKGLDDGITIVPVGGLDKVATFIALLKGNKLKVACLLDSFSDQAGKQRLDDLIRKKIIKQNNIHFCHEFAQ